MDIIVTTPKSQMANAAQEAADAIRAGGGEYFRRFHTPIRIDRGDRVYYVEDGFVRGFAVVHYTRWVKERKVCETTGRLWQPGFFVFMRADSWQWIEPISMRGFQGWRVAHDPTRGRELLRVVDQYYQVKIVGGWKDPKPEAVAMGKLFSAGRGE